MKSAGMWFAILATTAIVHGGTLYLSPDGDDDTGDGSSGAPFRNVKTAIAAADDAIAGGETEMTIYLAPGTYQITDGPATVANPIQLIGQGDAPTDVIVQSSYKNSGWGNTQDYGVFVLNHGDAVLSNLRVDNGFVLAWTGISTKAAGVHVAAGTVENCHITNCHSGGNNTNAGGLYLAGANAVATHCVISNCQVSHTNAQSWQGSRAAGVWMQGGRMEDCLIQGCYIDIGTIPEGKKYAGALLISGGTVVNCTFLNNRAKSTGGVSASGSAALWNCAIAANTVVSPGENTGANDHAFVGNTSYYHNCASDTTEPINASCVTGSINDLFADYANGDYSPRFGSVMIDGGDATAITETTDLAGEQRMKGASVDIGAYEAETRIAITITVETSEFGTVAVSDGPYYAGEDITLAATPNENCVFLCWDGDVPAALLQTASITFAPEANSVVFPRFAPAGSGPVVYVATTGNDANDGFSAEAPKATMRGAVATLEGSYGYGTVLVAPGTYSDPTPFVVTRPVAVLGTGSAPSDVVLRANGWYSGTAADHRVAILDNAGASIVNVTMENGFICNWDTQPSVHGFLAGSNVSILAGVVSNCVIQSGRGEGWWARSAWVARPRCSRTPSCATTATRRASRTGADLRRRAASASRADASRTA